MNNTKTLKVRNDLIDSYSVKIKVPNGLKKDKVVICDYVEYDNYEEDDDKSTSRFTLLDKLFNNTIKS